MIGLYFFGRTTPPVTNSPSANETTSGTATTADILNAAKKDLSVQQVSNLTQLENSVVRGDVKEQQIKVYRQLASYWQDSLHNPQIAAYYFGESAKLENSEKNLNFAARLLLQYIMSEQNPALQTWLATNAKALFEQSLKINPANDSVKVELGACYLFGNISNMPMEGIQKIKEVTDRNPNDMYAQLMLGLGDIKSGQYDKAIERLGLVAQKEPDNLQAVFNLAETYDRKGDKTNAVVWYKKAAAMVNIPEAKQEIEQRIKSLE